MARRNAEATRAYNRNWTRRRRAEQRLEKKMNLQTLDIQSLAHLKESAQFTKDIDLLNAIGREVWRRLNTPTRATKHGPVSYALESDGSISEDSKPLEGYEG